MAEYEPPTDNAGAELPPQFGHWPAEHRVEFFRLSKDRDKLLNWLIEEATGEQRQRDNGRLNKEELGEILETIWSLQGR